MDQWTNARPSLGPNGRDSPQPHGGTVGRPRGYASYGRVGQGVASVRITGGVCNSSTVSHWLAAHFSPSTTSSPVARHSPWFPRTKQFFCIWHSQYPRCANYAHRRVKHCTAKALQSRTKLQKKNFKHDEISCWPYKNSSERNSENFSKKTLLEDCKSVQNFLPPVFPLTTTARKCKTIAKKYKKKRRKNEKMQNYGACCMSSRMPHAAHIDTQTDRPRTEQGGCLGACTACRSARPSGR